MDLKQIICKNCGSADVRKGEDGLWRCRFCGHTFTDGQAYTAAEALGKVLSERDEELVASRRRFLWQHLKDEYISDPEGMLSACEDILKFRPGDVQARIYRAALSGDEGAINRALCSLGQDDYDYAEGYIRFLLTKCNITPRNLGEISNLLHRAFERAYPEKYGELSKLYAAEAANIDAAIYDPAVPRDVFVAHAGAEEDRKKAFGVLEFLEGKGYTCFISERNIRHGTFEDYKSVIQTALDSCKVFLLVSTKNSRDYGRDIVRLEIPYIRSRDTKIWESQPDYSAAVPYEKIPERIKKPRIEYRLDGLSGDNSRGGAYVRQFFGDQPWCTDEDQLISVMRKFDERFLNSDAEAKRQSKEAEKKKAAEEAERIRAEAAAEAARVKAAAEAERERARAEAIKAKAMAEAEKARLAAEERAKKQAEREKRAAAKRNKHSGAHFKEKAKSVFGSIGKFFCVIGSGIKKGFVAILDGLGFEDEYVWGTFAFIAMLFTITTVALDIAALCMPFAITFSKVCFYLTLASLVCAIGLFIYYVSDENSLWVLYLFIGIAMIVFAIWIPAIGRLSIKDVYVDEENGVAYAEYEASYEVYRILDGHSDVVISGEVNGKVVNSVNNHAARNNEDVVSLTFNDCEMEIYGAAFKSCSRLTSVTFNGGSYDFLSNEAFENCYNLADICVNSANVNFRWYSEDSHAETVRINGGSLNAINLFAEQLYVESDATVTFDYTTSETAVFADGFDFSEGTYSAHTITGLFNVKSHYYAFAENIYLPASVTQIPAAFFGSEGEGCTVYFAGTKEQWDSINISGENNDNYFNMRVNVVCQASYDEEEDDDD